MLRSNRKGWCSKGVRKNPILRSANEPGKLFFVSFQHFQFETTPWNSLSHYKSRIYIWYLIKASCCCCYSEKSDRPTRIGPRKNVRYVWKAADEVLGLRMRLMGITNSLGPVSWLILNNFFFTRQLDKPGTIVIHFQFLQRPASISQGPYLRVNLTRPQNGQTLHGGGASLKCHFKVQQQATV